jgi:hypothetical protein
MIIFSGVCQGNFLGEKFPVRPSKTELIALSAVLFLVVTQGGLFGTRPPGSPAKTSYWKTTSTLSIVPPDCWVIR